MDMKGAQREKPPEEGGRTEWAHGMLRANCADGVATILFDRPAKLNAMNREFWASLRLALAWVQGEARARALIITGAGTRAFSVGGDIASFAALETPEDRERFQVEAMAAFDALTRLQVPTIAAINGLALGGGCEVALACDFVLAVRTAAFGMPEMGFGLVPGFGVLRAASVLGRQVAKLMILADARLGAEEAVRHGLVLSVHDDDELMPSALSLARRLAGASATAVRLGKALIDRDVHDAEAIASSIAAVSLLHGTEESRTAVADFLARRGTPAPVLTKDEK